MAKVLKSNRILKVKNCKERGRNKCSNFEMEFFVSNKVKNAGIAIATASIFNEVRGKKGSSKMDIYFFVVPKD